MGNGHCGHLHRKRETRISEGYDLVYGTQQLGGLWEVKKAGIKIKMPSQYVNTEPPSSMKPSNGGGGGGGGPLDKSALVKLLMK